MLTQERLKQLLKYDPITGIFEWIPKPRSFRKNPIAGCKMKSGYIIIGIDREQHLAQRLAWLYMTGSFPELQIDHKDRVRSNNIWTNLREATSQQNNFNRSCKRDLPLGVYKLVRKGRPGVWYSAKIQKDGKSYSSTFRKLEDAIKWRQTKETEHFEGFK